MRYTLDACYLEIARISNMAEEHGMTLEKIVDLMKTLQAENVAKVVSSIEPLVNNMESRQERMASMLHSRNFASMPHCQKYDFYSANKIS